MQNRFISYAILVPVVLMLVACGGAKKATVKPVVKASVGAAPVMTPAHQQDFSTALAAMKSGDSDTAKALFTALIASYPTLAGAHVNLGLIALKEQNAPQAVERFNRALSINPQNVAALTQRGLLSMQRGAFREAEQDLLLAVTVMPDFHLAHYNLGVLYELYLQDYDAAIEHYEHYVAQSKEQDVDTVKRWIKLLERK